MGNMIEIVRKTNDYVIIYKPSAIPSQSDPSGDPDAMSLTSQMLREMGESGELFLIHRLDRVVGGLLVFARNKKSAATLSALVAERRLDKQYYAIVDGRPDGGVMKDYLYKDAALGKAFVAHKQRSGVKYAELEYKVLDTQNVNGREISLVKITLKTGRFHQIRAQFASRKMPLIGDKKYGSRDSLAKTPSLFAAELTFDFAGKTISEKILPDLTLYPWSLFEKEKYE